MANYEDKLTLDAFNGKLGKPELIREQVLEETHWGNKGYLYYDLSDIDWSEWTFVAAELHIGDAVSSFSSPFYFELVSITRHPIVTDHLCEAQKSHPLILFMPLHDETRKVAAITIPNAIYFTSKQPFSDITQLRFYHSSDSYLPVGTAFRLYGMR